MSRSRIGLLALAAACGYGRSGHEVQEDVPIVNSVPDSIRCLTPGTPLDTALVPRYPCHVVAVRTGVVLSPNADASPHAGVLPVAVDSRGRLYTADAYANRVLVWHSDGRLAATIGDAGQGPGEIARRPAMVMVDRHDSVFVRDGAGRWSVWSPDLEFVRAFQMTPGLWSSDHFIGGDRLLFTRPIQDANADRVMHFTDRVGRLVASVGVPRAGRSSFGWTSRPSAHDDELGVWIAPARGTGEGYVLENRDLEGRLLRTFRRNVEWLPLEGYADEPAAPDFKFLHLDSAAVLWLAVAVKDRRWSPRPTREDNDVTQADLRFEAIHIPSGAVLASVRFDSITESSLPPIYPIAPGRRMSFGVTADSLGQRYIGIYELALIRSEFRDNLAEYK